MASELAAVSLQTDDAQSKLEALKVLRQRLAETQLQCNRLEAALTAHNRPVGSIRALPSEILSFIFQLCLKDKPHHIRRLMQVCRRWLNLALTDTRFWTSIRILDGAYEVDYKYAASIYRPFIDACVRNSRSAPLHIELNFSDLMPWARQQEIGLYRALTSLYPNLNDGAITDWIEEQDWSWCREDEDEDEDEDPPGHYSHFLDLLRHMGPKSRWKSLEVTFPDDAEIACEMITELGGAMPQLHSLSINDYPDEDEDMDMGVLFEDLASLSFLRLPNINALCLVNISTLLQHLEVMSVSIDQQTMDIINQFGSLRTLKIGPRRYPVSSPDGIISLKLLNLRHLHIVSDGLSVGSIRFNLPSLQNLFLTELHTKSLEGLPNVQPIYIHWSLAYSTSAGAGETTEKILAKYPRATCMTVPMNVKKPVLELLQNQKSQGIFKSELEMIVFESRYKADETVRVDTI